MYLFMTHGRFTPQSLPSPQMLMFMLMFSLIVLAQRNLFYQQEGRTLYCIYCIDYVICFRKKKKLSPDRGRACKPRVGALDRVYLFQ